MSDSYYREMISSNKISAKEITLEDMRALLENPDTEYIFAVIYVYEGTREFAYLKIYDEKTFASFVVLADLHTWTIYASNLSYSYQLYHFINEQKETQNDQTIAHEPLRVSA